nr:hypothetical protein [Pseudoalteromonas sp. S1612]
MAFKRRTRVYLSGLLYETAKQGNDAYIDNKKELEIQPNNQYLQQEILRRAKHQGYADVYKQF